MALSTQLLNDIDNLQMRYIHAVDSSDMEGWLATFGPRGSYICTTAESEEAGLPIALALDDCYARLEDRVKFVDRVWKGTVHKYRTRHIVQRLICEEISSNKYLIQSNFIVAYTRSDTKTTEVYTSGRYIDEIEFVDEQAMFLSKKAIMDADFLKYYMVYPM